MTKRVTLMTAVTTMTAMLLVIPAVAQAQVIAHWKMNEHKGNVLHDSSGNHLAGHIGRHVILNGHDHRYAPIARGAYQPGRIDLVHDNPLLDPGDAPFAVHVQFLWNRNSDNTLVQKGQGSPVGGDFKMKTTATGSRPAGYIYCLFRGSTGDSTVASYSYPRLDDGVWHTITCKRTDIGTAMWVDGQRVDANSNDPGFFDNSWPVSIGGNSDCEFTTECNYWWGRIGDVSWEVG